MGKLVHIGTARVAGEPRLSITSVDRNLAGSNRSGKQRQLPDQAGTSESESADYSAASRVLSETRTGTQVEAGGGDCQPLDLGVVDQSIVNSDTEETGEMSEESEAAAARVAAELAASQTGGGDNDVQIIEPSPTCLDTNHMPKTVKSNIFTCAKSQATASRVIIDKLLVRCTSKVK